MAHPALEGENEVLAEVFHGQRHRKATIAANGNGLQALCVLERLQNGSTGIVLIGEEIPLVGKQVALDLHARKAVLGVGMLFQRFHIRLKAGEEAFVFLNLRRKMSQDVVLQAVLLALVIGLHQPQPRHVHIEVHFFTDALVSGAQRLDLGIGERRLVNILTASYRGF